MTVESTSKQTASAQAKAVMASAMALPTSGLLKDAIMSAPVAPAMANFVVENVLLLARRMLLEKPEATAETNMMMVITVRERAVAFIVTILQ